MVNNMERDQKGKIYKKKKSRFLNGLNKSKKSDCKMLMRSYLTLSTPQFIIDFEKWVAQPIGEALILNLFCNTDCCFTLTGCNVILHKTDPLKLP